MEVCPKCNGEQVVQFRDLSGEVFLDEECSLCEGSGFVDELPDEEE